MRIDHIAIWVKDLERTRLFYEKYFGAQSNSKYHNKLKNFQSYFLSFQNGCRLELMHNPAIKEQSREFQNQSLGLVHLAISVGSKEKVDLLTHQLREEGYPVVGEPRVTGDGYYESIILDPEENIVEITI